MSDLTPARRLRTRTSDLGDFFRPSHESHTRQHDIPDILSPGNMLPVPDSSTPKKKSSRIPFLGRTRRKSTHSDTLPIPSPEPNIVGRASSSADALSHTSPISAGEHLPISFSPEPHPKANSGHTLGSIFAAHFSPSKTKKLSLSPRRPSRTNIPHDNASGSLLPPAGTSNRPSSFDSTATSRGSGSITPTPSQPTITVSLSPDPALEDYQDLFTRPRRSKSAMKSYTRPKRSNGIQSEPETEYRQETPPDTPILQFSPDSASEIYSDTDAFPRASDAISITSSRSARWHVDSNRTTVLQKRRTVGSIPSKSRALRILENPSKPPDSPLPATPTSPPDSPTSEVGSYRRPRASTLSSITASRVPVVSPSHARRSSKTSYTGRSSAEERSEKENFDIENATAEQLRQALRARNQQFDDLASYLLKVTEAHVAERSIMEKRIAVLERETIRRDQEIKGLTWLVKNRNPGVVSSSLSDSASKSMSSLTATTTDDGTPIIKAPSLSLRDRHRHLLADDSESYSQTSGAESVQSETTSGGESSSSYRGKKIRRKMNDPRASMIRLSSLKPSGSVPELPNLMKSSKRGSAASLTSSVSTASTLPLPPTPPLLTAIPEAPPVPPKTYRDPAIAAAILAAEQAREKEERKAQRSANRLSAPNIVTSAPTPAAAYAANLRRGRPPSIAQVLNQPKESKLRPFGGNASPKS